MSRRTLDDLIAAARAKYPFRPPRAGEAPHAYREALARHVDKWDWACAHELRVGRVQADWTAADVAGFLQRARARTLPAPHASFMVPTMAGPAGEWPTTDEALRAIATSIVEYLTELRQADAAKDLAPMFAVLRQTGQCLYGTVSSQDRYAALEHLCRAEPTYGWALVFDGWIHQLTEATDTRAAVARRIEGILAHIGSRSMRAILRAAYRREGTPEHIIIEPIEDVRLEDTAEFSDPYAHVLLTVPTSTTPQ